jgi:putative ABC transport system substrate-binding protein
MLAAVLCVAAMVAAAQDAGRVRVVGIMRAASFERDDPSIRIMSRALQDLGYAEGRDFRFEQLSARNQADRLPVVAQEMVRRKVDVIVATTTAAARAAKEATSTIPIVMIAYDRDPVAAGLVQSLARPGGNVTGVSSLQQDLIGKRLEVLKEMLPRLSKVAVLHDASVRRFPEGMDAAARAAGVELQRIDVRWPEDIERAFRSASMNTDAVMVLFSSMFHNNRARIAAAALKTRMPTMCQELSFVQAGALVSYAPDRAAVLARVAYMIDRLFKGAKPGDLPVEQASKFVLAVNQGTAKKLGIVIPDSVLLRADEVVR